MHEIEVKLADTSNFSYHVSIGGELLKNFVSHLKRIYTKNKIVILCDNNIAKLYLVLFSKHLVSHGYIVNEIIIPHGEKFKNASTKEKIETKMFNYNINRDDLLIAFGGGVIGDLGGYVASTYMRGIKYVQIPTTLLAMVDSSVGGKTAINTRYGKNLIGTFYQPKLVFIDLNLLESLALKHIRNGLVEAIKIFIACNKGLFKYIEENIANILLKDKSKLQYVIENAISLKSQIITKDEKEKNLRMTLNLGHTIGHAIEKVSNYKIMHGIAVGLGILIEGYLSVKLGKFDLKDYKRIAELFSRIGISIKQIRKYDSEEIVKITLLDKKNKDSSKINCVLVRAIGEIADFGGLVTTPLNSKELLTALNEYRNLKKV